MMQTHDPGHIAMRIAELRDRLVTGLQSRLDGVIETVPSAPPPTASVAVRVALPPAAVRSSR